MRQIFTTFLQSYCYWLFCCCWGPAIINIFSAPGGTNVVGVPSVVGVPAVTDVHSFFTIMLLCGMLLLLVSSVVDIPFILVFPPLLAFILLLASLLCGWRPCCFSVHGVVGVSAVVIFLLKSFRKKIEAVFLNF
jgi:hypothetical protein